MLHGSWHNSRYWSIVEGYLKALGHRAVALDLDPRQTFDQQAAFVADAIKDERGVVLVSHSRAANVAPRVPDRVRPGTIGKLVLVAGSLLPATIGRYDLPPRNYQDFLDAIRMDGDMSAISPEGAMKTLYNCSPADIALAAAARLGRHRRDAYEPPMLQWPKIPTYYLRPYHDRAIRPEWVDRVSEIIDAQVVVTPGDHSPMLSCPDVLSRTMIGIGQIEEAPAAAVRLPVQRQPQTSEYIPRHAAPMLP